MISVASNLTPEKFLEKAGAWLEQDEARNNLLFGIARNISAKPMEGRQEHHFWLVKKDKAVAGAAVWTPPFKLNLSGMETEGLAVLARKVRKDHPGIPGVFGPQEVLTTFIRAWNAPGLQAELEMSVRLYQVENIEQVPPAPGGMRPAGTGGRRAFGSMAEGISGRDRAPEKIDERELIEGYIKEQRVFLWMTQQPTAMAGYGGLTPRGARINMVYTPRAFRKRGYASNLVASLSQRLLDSGKKFCLLYTDLLNPTSNHIYQKIGFQPMGDWDGYAFKEFKSL